MAEKNHVQVMIEGKLMTLVGTESPEYMKSVAEYIEEKNKEIRSGENGRKMNVAMASILTSINVADDYFKEKSKRKHRSPVRGFKKTAVGHSKGTGRGKKGNRTA